MFQDNQRSSLKALSAGVSAMQEQEEIDRGHLSVLQAQVLNFTASPPQVSMPLYFISAATTIIISTTTTTATTAAALLSLWRRVLFETQQLLGEDLSLQWNPKIRHCVHSSPPLFHVLSQINPVHSLQPSFFKTYFNTIFTSSNLSLFFNPFRQTSVCILLGSCAYYMPKYSDSFIIQITFGEDYKLRSSLLRIFLHHCIAFSHLGPNTALL
jgi:hypothetical protein